MLYLRLGISSLHRQDGHARRRCSLQAEHARVAQHAVTQRVAKAERELAEHVEEL